MCPITTTTHCVQPQPSPHHSPFTTTPPRSEEARKYRSKLQALQSHDTEDRAAQAELARLEDDIATRREELVAVKSQILRNDAAIERLLDMVCYGVK